MVGRARSREGEEEPRRIWGGRGTEEGGKRRGTLGGDRWGPVIGAPGVAGAHWAKRVQSAHKDMSLVQGKSK